MLEVRYLEVPASYSSLTIGVESPDGTVGTEHARNAPAVVPGLALRFSP